MLRPCFNNDIIYGTVVCGYENGSDDAIITKDDITIKIENTDFYNDVDYVIKNIWIHLSVLSKNTVSILFLANISMENSKNNVTINGDDLECIIIIDIKNILAKLKDHTVNNATTFVKDMFINAFRNVTFRCYGSASLLYEQKVHINTGEIEVWDSITDSLLADHHIPKNGIVLRTHELTQNTILNINKNISELKQLNRIMDSYEIYSMTIRLNQNLQFTYDDVFTVSEQAKQKKNRVKTNYLFHLSSLIGGEISA